jgi:hypothetical protein
LLCWLVSLRRFRIGDHIVSVQPGAAIGFTRPVREDCAQFLGLVGKDPELDASMIHLKVSAHSLEKLFRRLGGFVVEVGEIIGVRQDDLRLEHAGSSEQFLEPHNAIVNPLTFFLGNRQFGRKL